MSRKAASNLPTKPGSGAPMAETRYCNGHRAELPLNRFYRRAGASGSRYRSNCIDCEREQRAERARRNGRPSRKATECSECGEVGHNAKGCPERNSSGRFCPRCYGLAHHRDVPVCKRCGQPYGEAPLPTLEEIMERPREATR